MGRNLAALKAELGGQARSAFQALAGLKVAAAPAAPTVTAVAGGRGRGWQPNRAGMRPSEAVAAAQKYTGWTFGELPELMEVRKAGQTLIGFPALDRQGRARRDRGLRRTRGRGAQAPRRACVG